MNNAIEKYAGSLSLNIITVSIDEKGNLFAHLLFKLIFLSLLQFPLYSYVYADIRVGMTIPLSGPLQDLGKNTLLGVNTYFDRINSDGGINGEQIKLFIEDDQYEPQLAAPNMRKLIEEHKVIAVIANVGTPTAVVTAPIAIEKGIPFIGAITGAPLLRQVPPDRYIFNYRASYAEEAEYMVNGLLKMGIKPEEIAFFSQRDSYGDAGYDGAITALKNNNIENTHLIAHGRYRRNSLNVEGALATILDASVKPKAIIMAGSYKPSAKFIKLARQDLPDCLFLNLSFVGSTSLLKELDEDSENVIITQVVPNLDSDLPIVKDFLHDLKIYSNESTPSFISFESYIVAKIFVSALLSIKGQNINSESIVDALHQFSKLNIGLDIDISYSEENHQAIHKIWSVMIKNNNFVPVDWVKLGKKLFNDPKYGYKISNE